MSGIQIRNLNKRFGAVEVLKDINLEIGNGEFVVFVGPSGCGKSTLLRCISGLEQISNGVLEIDGKHANQSTPSERGVAMVFQSYALYPHMTVFDNMAYSLRLARTPKAELEAKVRAVSAKLHLTEYLDRYPRQLSGGQRQRVAIGRSIVRDPKVFLFDKPLSNLDASLRVQLRIEIVKLKRSLPNTAMVHVTHDQVEAMTMADRIVVLRDGRVEQVGTPLELYEKPNSLFVAQFIGSPKMNLMRGGAAAQFGADVVGVRPEHLEIVQDGLWRGSVIYTENLGSDSFVYVDTGESDPVIIRHEGTIFYQPGAAIVFAPRNHRYHLFSREGRPVVSPGQN
jgi:multiple sugar transport system ATP-binding protein